MCFLFVGGGFSFSTNAKCYVSIILIVMQKYKLVISKGLSARNNCGCGLLLCVWFFVVVVVVLSCFFTNAKCSVSNTAIHTWHKQWIVCFFL